EERDNWPRHDSGNSHYGPSGPRRIIEAVEQPREYRRRDSTEAPRHQQIEWSKQMTRRDTTPEMILALFEREGHRFEPGNLATTAHGVGKFGGHRIRSDRRLALLAETCRRSLRAFDSQHLANTAWGFAKTSLAVPQLFEAIAVEALWRVRELNSRDMANTLWAFACVAWAHNQVFLELGAAIAERVSDLEDIEKSQLYPAVLYVQITWPDLDFPLSVHLEFLRSARASPKPRAVVPKTSTENACTQSARIPSGPTAESRDRAT
ncbi:MAG: hypothetical protein AAF368_18145, partial [Planctomycetota bacterium]